MTTVPADLVTIGKIERHFGVRGEFKVRSLSDVPGRLDQLKQERVLSWLRQGAQPTVTVRTLLRRCGVWKQFEAEKAAKVAKKKGT